MAPTLKTKYHTLCDYFFPGQSLDTRDIDFFLSQKQMQYFSELTYHKESTFQKTSLRDFTPNLACSYSDLEKWILSKGKQHRVSKNYYINYCPSCFGNDEIPYFRKSWRLIISIVCTTCKKDLLDHCPMCKKPIDYLRLDIGHKEKIRNRELYFCYNCDYDLRKAVQLESTSCNLSFQLKINSFLKAGHTDALNYSHLYFSVIYLLMTKLSSNARLAVVLDEHVSSAMAKRVELISKTAWLLNHNMDEMISFFKQANCNSCIFLTGNDIPYWFWRPIHEGLRIEFSQWKKQNKEMSYLNSYNTLGKRKMD